MHTRLTPYDRSLLHMHAKNSTENGRFLNCNYNLYPKLTGAVEVDEEKVIASSVLAKVIFSKKEYAAFSLDVYDIIVDKVRQYYSPADVHVFVKGSSALAFYFMREADSMKETFPFSDLDITIYINPKLYNFHKIREHIKVIVGQTIAKQKQYLDKLLFKRSVVVENLEAFAKDHIAAFDEYELLSPFIDNDVRNASSSYSFSIVNSLVCPDKVVKITEAHFHMAEKIPLDKSPIFCTVNESICNVDKKVTHFDLYRLKWGAVDINNKRVSIDFVDIIIPGRNDSDLYKFFEAPINMRVLDCFGYMVVVPCLVDCVEDLWNLIYVYDCPEIKKEARLAKYNALIAFMNNSV